jgi:hypothetical protein
VRRCQHVLLHSADPILSHSYSFPYQKRYPQRHHGQQRSLFVQLLIQVNHSTNSQSWGQVPGTRQSQITKNFILYNLTANQVIFPRDS